MDISSDSLIFTIRRGDTTNLASSFLDDVLEDVLEDHEKLIEKEYNASINWWFLLSLTNELFSLNSFIQEV